MGLTMIGRARGRMHNALGRTVTALPWITETCTQPPGTVLSSHFRQGSVSQSSLLSGRGWVWRRQSISWRGAAQSGLQVNRLVKESVANEDHQRKEAQLEVAENRRHQLLVPIGWLLIYRHPIPYSLAWYLQIRNPGFHLSAILHRAHTCSLPHTAHNFHFSLLSSVLLLNIGRVSCLMQAGSLHARRRLTNH